MAAGNRFDGESFPPVAAPLGPVWSRLVPFVPASAMPTHTGTLLAARSRHPSAFVTQDIDRAVHFPSRFLPFSLPTVAAVSPPRLPPRRPARVAPAFTPASLGPIATRLPSVAQEGKRG